MLERKNMEKFAYLIMAHNDVYCYRRLIELLDDERNDIYVHIDKKSDITPFLKIKTQKSNIYFTDRIDVRWADVSQVETELVLIETALRHGHYSYYHLLSGVDLPLKTQNQIHEFFETNNGNEFIGVATPPCREAERRVKYHYHIRNHRNKNLIIRDIDKITNRILVLLQKALHLERKYDFPFSLGPNWFSITEDLCKYIIQNKKLIMSFCRNSIFCDEVFIQTLICNSSFKNKIYSKDQYKSCMREIDFTRGKPYIWRIEDYEYLKKSERMFARKFSSTIDRKIIDKIYEYLKSN